MTFARRRARGIIAALLALILVALLPELAMRFATQRFVYTDAGDARRAQAAIVLGASVYQGKPSGILAQRADDAIALYQAGTVSKILVTGDNGALNHNEVEPVLNYLLAAGIPGQDIFLDHAGFDTYSSMYRAKYIFGIESAIVATQDFHMPRALFVARAVGIDAEGVVASGRDIGLMQYLREIPASWKALFDLAIHRKPQYLGEPIPIEGNGQGTWY